tara:strand:+ start:400 stop:1689 length:1290 start_codon:yes stop_codon:yes gene_type:complete
MWKAIPRFQPTTPFPLIFESLFKALFAKNRQGSETRDFESAFARHTGAPAAVAVSSVRYGLYHTIKHLNLPEGTEVLCGPLNIYPVIETLVLAGLKPVFVDLQPQTFSLDLEDASTKISANTRLVFVTHLWGVPNDMAAIMEFCETHSLEILEDGSQCLNATINGKQIGTFGRAGFFSLTFTKTLNTFRGGMAVTKDPELADELRQLTKNTPPAPRKLLVKWVLLELALKLATSRRLFSIFTGPLLSLVRKLGGSDRMDHRGLGPENRLKEFPPGLRFAFSDIQAHIGIKLLRTLGDEDAKRRVNAMRYQERLEKYAGFRVPREVVGAKGNFWMYTVTLENPEKLKAHLWDNYRIDTILPSIDPCHEMPFFEELMTSLPNASMLARDSLYLPAFPNMKSSEQEHVIDAVEHYLQEHRSSPLAENFKKGE